MGIIDNWGLKITRVTVKLLGWITMFFSPVWRLVRCFPKKKKGSSRWILAGFAICDHFVSADAARGGERSGAMGRTCGAMLLVFDWSSMLRHVFFLYD
jgi:hypothetical protein